MNVGIVGSRRRTDQETRAAIVALVFSLPDDAVIVSGGAMGPDTFASLAVTERWGAAAPDHLIVHRPDYSGVTGRYDALRRPLERNHLIARDSTVIHAFVAPDRKGGTEDTIKRAGRLGRPVILHQ